MDTKDRQRDNPRGDAEYRAEQVLALLQKEACLDERNETAGRNALFARLYFFTTQGWVRYAKSRENSELLYLVVEHFYVLDRQYVGGSARQDRNTTANHWRLYQRLASNGREDHTSISRVVALLLGIRAHTRFDLAEAICFSHDSYEHQFGEVPVADHFRPLLFGKASIDVFRQASMNFFVSKIRRSKDSFVLKNAFRTLSWMWLPVFQFTRKLAWREARRSIETGTSICRQRCPAIYDAKV